MANCIYCRCALSTAVPEEHVIPKNCGRFKPDLTLNCVCEECNHYFGSKLEWPMLRQSVEGMRWIQLGFKGRVGGIRTDGVEPVIGEGYVCARARAALRTDDKGKNTIILTRSEGGEVKTSHSSGALHKT